MAEKIFEEGFVFKKNPNSPEFVIGRLSIKADEAINFIDNNAKNGWVNISIMQSRGGAYYCELDTFEPTNRGGANNSPNQASESKDDVKNEEQNKPEDTGDDLPF